MQFSGSETRDGQPMALLKDGERVVARVYLSPDQKTLRIALPEMQDTGVPNVMERGQVKVDYRNKLIDFRRKP